MHTYKRYLMMLVALLAMTTGAWADDLSELIITDGYDTSYTGEHFTITGTKCWEYGFFLSKAGPQTVTISSKNGEVITKIEMSYSYGVTYAASTTASAGTVSADGKSVTNVNATTVTIGTSAETTDDISISEWKIYYTAAPAGTALTPDATRKVWTLDAMPAGNVELQVEYYPGMLTFVSEHGTVTVEGLSETTLPAGFEMDAEGNIYVASGTIFTLKAEPAEGYKLASWTFGGTTVPDDGTGTLNMQMSDNDAIITANFEEMTYDLTVKAANEFSEGKIESVTVAGEAAEPDADGKISGVKKGQPIILKAKEGYKFRSVEAKKAAAATYTMAADAVAGDVGKLICADGHIHADGADTECTKARVAKIIYVGSDNGEAAPNNHGLALAMSDADGGNYKSWGPLFTDAGHSKQTDSDNFTIESGLQYNATHNTDDYPAFKAAIANNSIAAPTGCSAWFLASGYQWKQMFAGNASNLQTLAGLQSAYYWSSSENSTNNAWYFETDHGWWYDEGKGSVSLVRACLAF